MNVDGSNAGTNCRCCKSRVKMQSKWIEAVEDLYCDAFHITKMPLLAREVHGIADLKEFGKNMVLPYTQWDEERNAYWEDETE